MRCIVPVETGRLLKLECDRCGFRNCVITPSQRSSIRAKHFAWRVIFSRVSNGPLNQTLAEKTEIVEPQQAPATAILPSREKTILALIAVANLIAEKALFAADSGIRQLAPLPGKANTVLNRTTSSQRRQ